MQRAELHLHTKCSDTVSVISPEEAMEFAIENSCGAIAFTSRDSVQDFYDIAKAHQNHKELKVIYGAEVLHADEDGSAANGITVLVKNQAGLKGLYKIISSIEFDGACDLANLDVLKQNRKNLLFGSCGVYGLLYGAICFNHTNEQIERIAAFYDYFEIFPTDDPEEKEIYKKIYALGQKLGTPVVAAGNCHYVSEKDEVCRRVVRAMYGHTNDNKKLYFHTTQEMLEEFSYLGKEAAHKVVVENSGLIANLIEEVSPVREGFYPPKIENADEEISNIAILRAKEIYGENLPVPVAERLETELALIKKNNYAYHYAIAYRMAKHIRDMGGVVDSRGAVGSVFTAFLLGITAVNPLQQEFNIPYEAFMGYDGSKLPDIDLTVSFSMRTKLIKYMEEMFGRDKLAYAGAALGATDKRIECTMLPAYRGALSQEEMEYIIDSGRLRGIKVGESIHPGGIFVLPKEMSFEDFTPTKRNDNGLLKYTTHMDFHKLSGNLLKLDILGYATCEMLELLQKETGKSVAAAELIDAEIFEQFKNADTLTIPEFDNEFTRNLLLQLKPESIEDLVKIVGLAHGTNVWLDNGETLICEGKALSQLAATRDDVFLHLIDHGIDRETAYKISETVRRGRLPRANAEYIKIMQNAGVEPWYIQSLLKIRYMFPKAHAVAYVINALRCAWFRKHYPAEYRSAYETCFSEQNN